MTKPTNNHTNSAASFFAGLLVGGFAGTAAALLMAPQSGQQTRDQIQARGIQLRHEATETVDHAVEQARLKGQQLSTDVRAKAGELQQRGQSLIDDKREQLSTLVSGDNHEVKLSS
jgi:gas vesicle protein